jgi:hypothetical protein
MSMDVTPKPLSAAQRTARSLRQSHKLRTHLDHL